MPHELALRHRTRTERRRLRPRSGSRGRLPPWFCGALSTASWRRFRTGSWRRRCRSARSHLGEAVGFFIYETPKVLMLLTLVVFAMGVVRSFFSPERTRALLAGKREGLGNVRRPVWASSRRSARARRCRCSSASSRAGVPLGVTFSFLIAAPMVNEVALGLLFALIGWKVALTYLGFGLVIAIVAGWVIGRLHLEGWLEEWVRNMRAGGRPCQPDSSRRSTASRPASKR